MTKQNLESNDESGQTCIRQDVPRDWLVLFRGILMLLEYPKEIFVKHIKRKKSKVKKEYFFFPHLKTDIEQKPNIKNLVCYPC